MNCALSIVVVCWFSVAYSDRTNARHFLSVLEHLIRLFLIWDLNGFDVLICTRAMCNIYCFVVVVGCLGCMFCYFVFVVVSAALICKAAFMLR